MTQTAPALKEDTHGVIPYAGIQDLSLFQIDEEIEEFLELAEDPELDEESRAAVDKQTAHYMNERLKRDAVGRVLHVQRLGHSFRALELLEAAEKAEAERHAERARKIANRTKRLKEYVLRTMQAHQVKRIDVPGTTLRLQNNGGLEPMEIDQTVEIEPALQDVTVTLPGEVFDAIRLALEGKTSRVVWNPNQTRIRSVLRGGPVPGVRLLPRAQHLRVE